MVSRLVREFLSETVEHILSLFNRSDRDNFFNDMAKQFNVKVKDENKQTKPLHIEMVRDNFHSIVSALRVYEQKQVALEE